MAKIRAMVADDHPLITQALASELASFGVSEVIPVADGNEVVRAFLAKRPEVLVLDLRIGQVKGLEVARELLAKAPGAKIVIYSQFDQDHIVREAYRLGAKAFVPKSAEPKVLAEAIAAANAGKEYFLPSIAQRLAMMSVRGEESPQAKLSERELAVFTQMAQGLTNEEIAEAMKLSTKTIGLISQAIKQALGVSRPAEITRLAIRYQLIDE